MDIDKTGLRKFGIVTGVIFGSLFGAIIPYLMSSTIPTWPWVLCALLVGLGVILPQSLRIVYKSWMAFGNIAGAINSRIILSIIYYLMIFPIGLGMKIFGRDLMKRLPKNCTTTNWEELPDLNPKHYERPY